MKIKTTIKKVTYDELVALLDTYASFWSVKYDNDVYKKFNKQGEALEEACATMLLGGESIKVLDYKAEDEDEFYGHLPHEWDDVHHCMVYTVNIDDIKQGLANAFDGTFIISDVFDDDEFTDIRKTAARYATDLATDVCDVDTPCIETLMQIILFDEIIYG